jgi:fructose-bisphosphate aldolase, class II
LEVMTKLYALRFNEFGTAGQAGKIKKVLPVAEMAKRYAKGELRQKFA